MEKVRIEKYFGRVNNNAFHELELKGFLKEDLN